MLQITHIRENKEETISRLNIRSIDSKTIVETLIEKDETRRAIQTETDALLAHSNHLARQIGDLYKKGERAAADTLKAETFELKIKISEAQQKLVQAEDDLYEAIVHVPNTPHISVPKGKTPEENLEVYAHGEIPMLYAGAKPHWELASQYDLIDFELGVKIAGAGFPVYKGRGAKYQRALIQFFLDQATQAGYLEVQPPLLVNEASCFGTGQLPDKEGQMYHCGIDNLYLIPTSEVPVTNLYRDMIIKAEDLPIKNTAYSPCFRREAGSYGKDVRGLNRLHQFDKVEIVQIQHPDKSYEALEDMREYVAELLRKLELPFRILKLCGGDMGFASAFTYDMEVYSAAQKKWLEVSSVSNFESFQANRLKLRIREANKKPFLAHTLNGSALALPRILASLLENNQDEKGIRIPKALVPYTGFERIE